MGASRTIDIFDGKSHSLGMTEKEKYPSELAERFQIRLPAGLRDRIKAYAERHGRSMNTEIVRVLEREFPETWPLSVQITQLVSLSNALKETIDEEHLNQLGDTLLNTVKGVASGRVRGVDEATRESVASWLRDWEAEFDEVQRDDFEMNLDEEELRTFNRVGTTSKFVDPFEDQK
ncbi:UNVERIFIED_ORG: plasmid stability protein [Rhizobium esperanzae]